MANHWATENLWENRPFVAETAYCSLTLVSTLVRWFEDNGYTSKELLSGTGIDQSRLSELNYTVNYNKYKKMMTNAHQLWAKDNLGLNYGLDLRFTSFGIIGHAAITSPTVRTALDIFTRFFTLKVKYVHYQVEYKRSDLTFTFFSELPDDFITRFHIDSSLGSMIGLFQQVYGDPVDYLVRLKHDGGGNPSAFEMAFDDRVTFNAPENSITFKHVDLDKPSLFANPISSQLGVKYCEIEYQAMKRSRLMEQIGSYDLVEKIQSAIANNLANPPSISKLSRELGMSERSLRRMIAEFKLSYRQILNETRAEFAAARLKGSGVAISTIAGELGYENAANFSRAFKKWFGMSPLEFRNTAAEFSGR